MEIYSKCLHIKKSCTKVTKKRLNSFKILTRNKCNKQRRNETIGLKIFFCILFAERLEFSSAKSSGAARRDKGFYYVPGHTPRGALNGIFYIIYYHMFIEGTGTPKRYWDPMIVMRVFLSLHEFF